MDKLGCGWSSNRVHVTKEGITLKMGINLEHGLIKGTRARVLETQFLGVLYKEIDQRIVFRRPK